MRVLMVHPSALMYSKIFLRLEPLGLELVAQAAREAGHDVRIIDLQTQPQRNLMRILDRWRPEVVAFSCNYLANVPEIIDLSQATRERLNNSFIFVGGHSASFIAREFLEHGKGAIDCVLRGEAEAAVAQLLEVVASDKKSLLKVPGIETLDGQGPPPLFVGNLDHLRPARDLLPNRRKYFLGVLDPCASIEFSRGCPWDCVFCSAWTFYGRSYRVKSPEVVAEELEQIRESGVFIVDDVSFLQRQHGMAIGEAIARKGIRKQYYLETRGDVLLRNKDVFEFWKKLGLKYMFLGLEAIDDEGLKRFRKRVHLSKNFEALQYARSTGITVAVNLIADPDWDKERFETIRKWCLEIPEIVSLSVNTPYPGTESWRTESRTLTTRDYRLFDIQHAVLPTRMSLEDFYAELVKTQRILHRKHLGWSAMRDAATIAARRLLRGQTNFVKMMWKFDSVYHHELQLADHLQPVQYQMKPPPAPGQSTNSVPTFIHAPQGRRGRTIDQETESFVNQTRMNSGD